MAYVKSRGNKFEARVRIPKALETEYGDRELLYRTLKATDRRAAKLEAEMWEMSLKAEWAARGHGPDIPAASLRDVYDSFRSLALRGEYKIEGDPEAFDEITAGIDHALDRMADEVGPAELTPTQQRKVWALNDAKAIRMGRKAERRRQLEPTFREVAAEHLRQWQIAPGRKPTNTGTQKAATFDLFASFYGEHPIREVGRAHAAEFVDALRQLDPAWPRTGKAKGRTEQMSWHELIRSFGGREKGLADATVNRHMATLSALWQWAEDREHCEGRNPFQGHQRKLKLGRNKRDYLAWKPDELHALFNPPPKREDVTEVMLVAMFTGMRLNEIASLTFGQIREEQAVPVIDITNAKTTAGERLVPIHPQLGWLLKRAEGQQPGDRVWPGFRAEGPGAKPGAHAGKEFSRFKRARGFKTREKAFHSFRKNVVGQLEAARVPENEVAMLVGHEKRGFTFRTYGNREHLHRLAENVRLIEYPDLELPQPSRRTTASET
ncbi:MAG: tyrosine-type recombinase/integrase [Sphingomonadaceae bacterium]